MLLIRWEFEARHAIVRVVLSSAKGCDTHRQLVRAALPFCASSSKGDPKKPLPCGGGSVFGSVRSSGFTEPCVGLRLPALRLGYVKCAGDGVAFDKVTGPR